MLLLVTLLAAIDPSVARRSFEELDAMCRADAARLWGVPLCGPILFADPRTREAVLWDGGAIQTATLPKSVGIANTAVEWEGKRWTMVMWPLPAKEYARRSLLAHESFHRVQAGLGFPATGPSNKHLDDAEGRYWMRLEWRALARALETNDKRAVADALAFRAKRRALIADADRDERLLEMDEGLAEYTGTALAEPDVKKRAPHVVAALRAADKAQTIARSFAYTSGPAWGALIEAKSKRWTRRLKNTDDLGTFAQRAWRVKPVDAEQRASAYDGVSVRAEETARSERLRAERAVLRARFLDGPTLTLPLTSVQLTFDPNTVQPFDEHGTIYRAATFSDAWGRVEVAGGAMVTPDWKKLVIPAGEKFELTLNAGWVRQGNVVVIDKR